MSDSTNDLKTAGWTQVVAKSPTCTREVWLAPEVAGVALAMLASVATEVDTPAPEGREVTYVSTEEVVETAKRVATEHAEILRLLAKDD